MKKKVLILATHSGGHIFPALALADCLQNKLSLESIFITDSEDLRGKIEQRGHSVIFTGDNLKYSRFVLSLGFDILQSLRIIKKFRPCIVIGFGGRITIIPIIIARICNIPTLIHEQNAVFGRANRLLKFFSDKTALGFPQLDEDKEYLNRNINNKVVFTGNPIREEFLNPANNKEESRRFFGFSADKFTILVMGGSQGSHKINTIFLEAIDLLKDTACQVIHISGVSDYDFVSEQYNKRAIAHKVFRFLDNIYLAYQIADLAISRAGAMTLAELSLFGIPAILIPYPYAGGHQKNNASIFRDMGAALVISEKELSRQRLFSEIKSIMDNPERASLMCESIHRIAVPEAADNLIKEILEVANV